VLYLVRHGESTWNVQRRVQGQTAHPPLTAAGCRQVATAAAMIAEHAGQRVGQVVSSDLVRARQSADLVAEVLGVDVRVDERLREWHLGAMQGLPTEQAFALVADLDWTDPDAPVAGGETARQVHERMAAVLTEQADTTAVLVSHGDALRAALNWWSGHAPAQGPWVDVPSAAVFVLEHRGRWTQLFSAAPARPE
jgi:2,3-bisphosphoglycerate-dependent phosphoglycerate mutase